LRLKVGEEALDTILQTCYYLEGRFLSMEKAENSILSLWKVEAMRGLLEVGYGISYPFHEGV
jgi:hypothetical protein